MRRKPARLLGLGLLAAILLMGSIVSPLPALASEEAAASSGSSYATWYGSAFQGRVMANGQRYNMYDPTTTASNWFPFNTWLKITNLKNGRSVTVRVTDRGHFSWVVDLSYAAFAKIASPSAGRIAVRYQVVSRPGVTSRPIAPAPAKPATTRAQVTSRSASRSSGEARPTNVDYRTYVVRAGDTLSSIARLFGVNLGALVSANGLANPNLIHPQQRLAIPEADKIDVALYGDSLNTIAARNGVTVKALFAVNDLRGFGDVYPGQAIHVP